MKTKTASSLMFTVILSICGSVSFAQTGGNPMDARCDSYLAEGRLAMGQEDYRRATQNFFSADKECKEKLGKDDFERYISSARRVVSETEEIEQKPAVVDMLLWAWERAEARGFYDVGDDAERGYYYTFGSRPDYARTDYYMKRAIEREGADIAEQLVPFYLYNIYVLWHMEKNTVEKAKLKQRVVTEHSRLSKLVKDAGFSQVTQQTLDQYLSATN